MTRPRWWEWIIPPVIVGYGLWLALSNEWDWTRFWPMVIVAVAMGGGLAGRQYHASRTAPDEEGLDRGR